MHKKAYRMFVVKYFCSINVKYYWIFKTYFLHLENEDYLAIGFRGAYMRYILIMYHAHVT